MYLLVVVGFLIVLYGIILYSTTQHNNFKERELAYDYYLQTAVNFTITILLAVFLLVFQERLFVPFESFDIKRVIFFFLVIDAIYYWVHRTTHRVPSLRRLFHAMHHDAVQLVPLDFLHVTTLEYVMYILFTNLLPLIFLPMNIAEYGFVFLTVLAHAIYCHSDVDSSFVFPLFIDSAYHQQHHQKSRGNYSVFFPIWDDFMKTRFVPVRSNETKENEPAKKDETRS